MKNKNSAQKGCPKKHNDITWQRFKAALEGKKDMATNLGFRQEIFEIVSYKQQSSG